MSSMKPIVEIGFVIVKPSGGVWDEYLYPSREDAERMAGVAQQGLTVHSARRVHSLRKINSTSVKGWTDLIIDRGDE